MKLEKKMCEKLGGGSLRSGAFSIAEITKLIAALDAGKKIDPLDMSRLKFKAFLE